MALVLAASAMADFLNRLFRLVVLLVRIWLPKALERMILPFPVVLKRLAAPLLVFILGMTVLSLTPSFLTTRKKSVCPAVSGIAPHPLSVQRTECRPLSSGLARFASDAFYYAVSWMLLNN
jgi:hypothetical protein